MQTKSEEVLLTEIINTGGALLAGKTISGGAHLTESTTLGGVHQVHRIKITGADIEMRDLNLAVQARPEENLQGVEIQQIIQTVCVVA